MAFLTPCSPAASTSLTCSALVSLVIVNDAMHFGFLLTIHPFGFYQRTAALDCEGSCD